MSTANNIYFDPAPILEDPPVHMSFVYGGRGCGKTYGTLKYLSEHEEMQPFIHMRRTAKELDLLFVNKETQPFSEINQKEGTRIIAVSSKGMYSYYNSDEDGAPVGAPIGYAMALSTCYNVRGLVLNMVKCVFYDEFVPELSAPPIRHEGDAFANFLETVNRNREFEGERPLRVICCTNANNAISPILAQFGLISKLEAMIRKGKSVWRDPARGVALYKLEDSGAFTAAKANTFLYKLMAGTEFSEMALNNDFAYNDMSDVEYRSISEYRPLYHIDDIYVYVRKGGKLLYVTYNRQTCPGYTNSQIGLATWEDERGGITRKALAAGLITFESYDLKSRFFQILKIKE